MIPTILQLGAGGILLIAGKKLYWFVVGVCGAIAGLFVSEFFFHPESWGERVLVAVGIGAAFAVLALVLQQIMISIAGFIAGGFLGVSLVDTLKVEITNWNWVVFILGGLVGILIVKMLFDLSLVIISSFAGATLIIRALNLDGPNGLIILLVLILTGIVLQSFAEPPQTTGPNARPTSLESELMDTPIALPVHHHPAQPATAGPDSLFFRCSGGSLLFGRNDCPPHGFSQPPGPGKTPAVHSAYRHTQIAALQRDHFSVFFPRRHGFSGAFHPGFHFDMGAGIVQRSFRFWRQTIHQRPYGRNEFYLQRDL